MTDLIKREDAIELCAEAQGKASTKSELKGISRIWKGLRKLPLAEADWIPCSERLPKHGDDILVTYSDGEVSIVRGARSKYWMKWGAMEDSNLILPIAWMPLPKPYRKDDEV